ncbi:MAG: spore maturation protein [Bacteroidales bacterium]|nr:spore maturation protein [Bacteroidales bacterium]
MVLNYIWILFFVIAFISALIKLIFFQDMTIFSALVQSTFDMAKTGFDLSLGLTGVLALWMGIMKIGEKAGMVKILSRLIGPFFQRLFPELDKDHPAFGSMMLNIAANMLGLDNAATPMGLKAMSQLQETNKKKDTASNAMIMFLVLNTSGLTLIPISVMVYRAQMGAANPADVFVPILLATSASTIAGLITVALYQKINLFDKVILAYLAGFALLISGLIYQLNTLPKEQIEIVSTLGSNILLFSIIISFIVLGFIRKINVYESFIEGAKDGFGIAIKIIPYLIAILVAIGVFRESGTLDYITSGIAWLMRQMNVNTDFVDALPTALMKPLSGSGARGFFVETMKEYGPDSFAGKLAATFQGATDTTFYIIAVYFGSVGIKKLRHAVPAGLIADFVGIIAAIFIAYFFFH